MDALGKALFVVCAASTVGLWLFIIGFLIAQLVESVS